MNQEGCVASRHHFVEGTTEQVDRYCDLLIHELGIDRDWADQTCWRTPSEIRDNVDVLKHLDGYRVWGAYRGNGLVIRSNTPVDFHPSGKTVNVIPVERLCEATAHATVATQTVGVYPRSRKRELRDQLATCGVQRIVSLGGAMFLAEGGQGLPHDGSLPLQRLVRWISDED